MMRGKSGIVLCMRVCMCCFCHYYPAETDLTVRPSDMYEHLSGESLSVLVIKSYPLRHNRFRLGAFEDAWTTPAHARNTEAHVPAPRT
jgi:hypothetical protein